MKFDLTIEASTIINDVSTIDNIGQFSIAIGNLIKGDSGKSPYIDDTTKTWWEYNDTTKEYENTGIAAKSVDIYNITNEIPLGVGLFYTLSTAITATPIANRKKGLLLMFESKAGVWETYQFKGVIANWSVLGSWSNDLSLKIDKTAIKHVLGTSTTDVMSQKAVTDFVLNNQSPLFKSSQTFGLTDAVKINALKNCVRAFTVDDDGTRDYAISTLTISGGLQIYIADVTGKADDYVPQGSDCPFYYIGSSSSVGIQTFTLIDNPASSLPYYNAKITIDMDLFKSMQPLVSGGITTALSGRIYLNKDIEALRKAKRENDVDISLIENYLSATDTALQTLLTKYYNFNGSSSKYLLSKEYTLAADGDYVELLVRPNGNYNADNFDKIGLIGKGSNLGTFGIHPTLGLYYRDNSTAGVGVGTNNVTLGAWHTVKLAIVGTNYVIYHNGVAVKTTSKLDNLSFSRLGGTAYFTWYSPIDMQYLKINTSVDGLVVINDFISGTQDTDIEMLYEKKFSESEIIYPKVKYQFNLATNTFIVFHSIGHEYYNGIQISKEYNMSDLVYIDYWRIINSKLYSYDGIAFTEVLKTVTNVLDGSGNPASVTTSYITTNGESEFVFMQNGKSDHTGGIHGDEITTMVNFFADGVLLDISANIPLTECTKFSYIENSTMHETSTDGINHIAGHPIVAYHYKRTEISEFGFKTNNRIKFNAAITVDRLYAGIYCASRLLTKYAFDEKQEDIYDMDTQMASIGGAGIVEYNANNALSLAAKSKVIAGGNPTLAITDNLQPLTYKKYYCYISGSPNINDEWWTESEYVVCAKED